MRILFFATPALGHLLPLLPLARAARDRGHDAAVLTAKPLSSQLDTGIELLSAGPMPDVLFAEVRRRCGADPTTDPRPEVVAEFFAGTRVDLTFEQALAAAKAWQPDLIVFECCDFVGPLVTAVLRSERKLAYGSFVPLRRVVNALRIRPWLLILLFQTTPIFARSARRWPSCAGAIPI